MKLVSIPALDALEKDEVRWQANLSSLVANKCEKAAAAAAATPGFEQSAAAAAAAGLFQP